MTSRASPGEAQPAPNRPPMPAAIRVWSWGNAFCLVAFVAMAAVVPVSLPLVAIVLVAAVLQFAIGLLLLTNRNGLAEAWAAWGRSRPALIGAGSSSVALNRLQGAFAIVAAFALVVLAIWVVARLRPLV